MAQDLETTLLRAFVTAVRTGSISRAAAAMAQSQPALSLQLRKLERTVGQPLLHRTPTGVTPTPAGEVLLPYAERILALTSQALAGTREAVAGHCGIGLMEDLTVAPLPEALAEFAELHPQATLEVLTLPGPEMAKAFSDGRLHVALFDTAYLPEPPRWTVRMPLAWAAAPTFDVTQDPLPLIMFSQPCRWRPSILDTLDRAGRKWRIVFESTSLMGIQAAIRAGLGVGALIPRGNLSGLKIRPPGLPGLPDIELGLVRRPGFDGDPLVDAVDALLRQLA
jgi:DNA-binding transcriptional LysR family regulator